MRYLAPLLLAVFSTLPCGAFTVVYDVDEQAMSAKPKAGAGVGDTYDGRGEVFSPDAKMDQVQDTQYKIIVATAKNGFSVGRAAGAHIFNIAKRRLYDYNTRDNSYSERSLYSDVAFREKELGNRNFLRKLQAEKFGDQVGLQFDPIYSESMMGMKSPETAERAISTKIEEGKTNFQYKDQAIASFTQSPNTVPVDAEAPLSMFYIYETSMHPEARLALERGKKVPQRLSFHMDNSPAKQVDRTFELLSVSTGNAKLELPKDAKRVYPEDSPIPRLRERIKELGGKPAFNQKAQLVAYVTQARAAGRIIDAFLAVFENMYTTGERADDSFASLKQELLKTEDGAQLLFGMRTPQDATGAKQFQVALDGLGDLSTKTEKAYVVDIFRAKHWDKINQANNQRRVNLPDRQNPTFLYLRALQGNPFMGGVYAMLGEQYVNDYQTQTGWDVWDLGREVCPKNPMLDDVDAYEKKIEAKHPEFFLGDKID
jgi:hypothetical protein